MSRFLPTVEEERAFARGVPTGWKTFKPIVAVVFFALTSLGVIALDALFNRLQWSEGTLTCVICLAIAELLIVGFCWFGTGVEQALWVGGLFAFIFGLPSTNKPEALLAFAAASALAGLRLRNAWFGGLAAVIVLAYAQIKSDVAIFAAVALVLLSLFALTRAWQRPSTERLWSVLLVIAPPAAYIAMLNEESKYQQSAVVVLFSILGAFTLAAGIRYLHRAMLWGALASFAVAGYAARDLVAWPLELKLALAGAFLLITSFALSRILRHRTTGIVIAPVDTSKWLPIETLGALAMAPHASATPEEAQPATGGDFGGAGATGSF